MKGWLVNELLKLLPLPLPLDSQLASSLTRMRSPPSLAWPDSEGGRLRGWAIRQRKSPSCEESGKNIRDRMVGRGTQTTSCWVGMDARITHSPSILPYRPSYISVWLELAFPPYSPSRLVVR